MAAPATMSPDVLITIKLLVGSENRRFKLPLRDLGANSLPDKLRSLLAVPPTKNVVFERYSDSAGTYITLDSNNPSVYKQLYRAAKAKLKLRIKATVVDANTPKEEPSLSDLVTPDRLTSHRYVPPMVSPMNPDPLSCLRSSSDVANPHQVTPIPSVQAVGDPSAYQAYARRLLHQSMASHTPAIGTSGVASVTSPNTPQLKVESSVTIKQEANEEAPVPRAFSERELFYTAFSNTKPAPLRAADQSFHVSGATFTVCCNNCSANIPDAHWHCSICQDGDFDLCHECMTKNIHCGGTEHFLIKRSIENGRVISSTTETVPKRMAKIESEKEVPGAFTTEVKEEILPEMHEMSRTCNSCVMVFLESNFVTCMVCEDYDLCIPCHVGLKHGHHPNHTFVPVSEELTLSTQATLLCAPGRHMRHFAICDGCDAYIYGVRNKCLNCPDWDYCSTCVKHARYNHPGHRFVPIYESLPSLAKHAQVHHGINCDGPLCKDKLNRQWITGDRYKCAVCHDTDFCANCEALPTNRHNRTHPLIKFRTPVRNVSVTTLGEKENGEPMCTMGDRVPANALSEKMPQTSSKSTETMPSAPSANAATQVQTVAEVKPSEPVKDEPLLQLQAHFIRDAIPDGSKVRFGQQLQQVWVLRNPGPLAWPAGCRVRFVGGDSRMLNVDYNHPSTAEEVSKAIESNVIDRVVEVGEEVCFFVKIKVPRRLGKAISYWCLKAADSTPFGHKLWCDIDVVEDAEGNENIEYSTRNTKNEEATEIKEEPKNTVEQELKEEVKAEEHQSQMIFPKLDKESPVSSTHEGKLDEQHVTPPPPMTMEEAQLLQDVESLELDDDETSDDGFLTDEEYEILDAESNDEEAINGKK